MIRLFLSLIFILFLVTNSFAVIKIKKRNSNVTQKTLLTRLNTQSDFEQVQERPNSYVFLIGNDKYSEKSNFWPLKECYNDVRLLAAVFEKCVKIPEKNIYKNRDLTLEQFIINFKAFLKEAASSNDNQIIITYSGHGDEDGSLVFVDGQKLSPKQLRELVNSFSNDTILMLDACYSGNNEGPKEAYKLSSEKKKKAEYKKNSYRIYASLAHLTAKEIHYKNNFFAHVKPFYKNVLGIEQISGNGYFSAMIGFFFAEYNLAEDENISFKDLISYVTNKGKSYVEFLAILEKREASVRLNQQPKILPLTKKVRFNDINNEYILIQEFMYPAGIELGLEGGFFFPMGTFAESYSSPTIMTKIYFNYWLEFIDKNLFITANFYYFSMSRPESDSQRSIDITSLIGSLGLMYKFELIEDRFYLNIAADGGYAMNFFNVGSFGPIKEESTTANTSYFGFSIQPQFKFYKNLAVTLKGQYMSINYSTQPLYGIAALAGINYFF